MKQYAVITGASSGMGVQFARYLSKMGYSLILIARRKQRLEQLAQRLHTKCEVITADLAKEEECYRVWNEIKEKNIAIFINNAGFGGCGRFIETELQSELDMIRVNVNAVHLFMKLVLQKMQRENQGYILNVASAAGLVPAGPYRAAYYATKSYVASLTRGIAHELQDAKSKVYVGCLCPGPVATEFDKIAKVKFTSPPIQPDVCVKYALRQMFKRKVVIVPTMLLKLATLFGRFVPQQLSIRVASKQQSLREKSN